MGIEPKFSHAQSKLSAIKPTGALGLNVLICTL